MHKRMLPSFISPLYVTGRKSETIIPLLQAYFKSLLGIWNLWRSLRSCILYMLKVLTSSSGSQLTWGCMHSLLEADGGFPQPSTKEARHEPAPIWERDCHATLSSSVTAGQQSPPRYILDLENSLWKSFICYCCVAVWMCLWHLTHTLRLIAQLCFH